MGTMDAMQERFKSCNRHGIAIVRLAGNGREQTIYPLHRAVIELSGFAPVILAYANRAANMAEPMTDDIQGLRAITLPVALQLAKDGFTPHDIMQENGHDIKAILKATVSLYKDGYALVLAELPKGQAVE